MSTFPIWQVGELLSSCGTTERGSASDSWEERKREHDNQVKAGHAANRQGSSKGAMDAFERACKLFPKVSTLLSAINMRFHCLLRTTSNASGFAH